MGGHSSSCSAAALQAELQPGESQSKHMTYTYAGGGNTFKQTFQW